MGDLSNNTVKNLFLTMVVILPLQYAFVGILGPIYGEPWPAFVLPGFKKVYHHEDLIKLNDVAFIVEWDTDSGESFQQFIPKDSLFNDIPRSQLGGFIESHLRYEEQIQSLSGEGKNWLKNRIGDPYPARKAIKLQIQWKNSTYRLGEEEIIKGNNQLVDEFTILLDES